MIRCVDDNLCTPQRRRFGSARGPIRARRGSVLIVTTMILFTLASVVLILSQRMSVEAQASANESAGIQASTIERGAEQYVLALLNVNGQTVMDPATITDDYFTGVQVGDGYFWIVRPNYNEEDLPVSGLVDECSKLDLNANLTNSDSFYNALMYLPGMTDDVASAIVDWRDTDDDVYSNGAESQYYLTQPTPYYAKNQPFEAVEELLMVRGVYRDMLYGDGSVAPLGDSTSSVTVSTGAGMLDPDLARGWYDLLTVNGYAPQPQGGGGGGGGAATGPARGLININTAPRAVLVTLEAYGLEDADVEGIIGYRLANDVLSTNDTSWLATTIGQAKANQIAQYITGQSYRYSADIVAVSHNGRGFRRVRIVVDASTTPAVIISRRDMTDLGWPMDPTMLASIRAGTYTSGGGVLSNIIGGALR